MNTFEISPVSFRVLFPFLLDRFDALLPLLSYILPAFLIRTQAPHNTNGERKSDKG